MGRIPRPRQDRESGPVRAEVYRDLVAIRLADARALLSTGVAARFSGALYLAGYAVECALKARICVAVGAAVLPRQHEHHRLEVLAAAAGQPDGRTCETWAERVSFLASRWYVTLRYKLPTPARREVELFINRAEEFVGWLK